MTAIIITSLGGNCPVQADGTVDGAPFYFRARGEHWSFSVGNDPVAVCCGLKEGFHHEEFFAGGPYAAGWMSDVEAKAFIAQAAGLYIKSLGDEPPFRGVP